MLRRTFRRPRVPKVGVIRGMVARLMTAFLLCLLGAGWLPGQVIFSRRVYAEHGRTYQQIWEWRASDGTLRALTHSPRNHFQPINSRDGTRAYFLAGSDEFESTGVWRLDRSTGQEREILPGKDYELIGVANNG